MNKLYFLFLASISISLFTFSSTSFATSGACSSHDGVNCGAGSDWDGSVICNDGWRDSTVSYSDMESCNDYDDLEYKLYLWGKITPQDCINWIGDNTDIYSVNECTEGFAGMNRSCEEMQQDLSDSGLTEMFRAFSWTLLSVDDQTYLQKCEPYYILDEDLKLSLKSDFDMTPSEQCQATYGEHSYSYGAQNFDGTYNCYCLDGYGWNQDKSSCVAIEMLSIESDENIGSGFSDVPKLHRNSTAIEYLYKNGIVNGYPDGTFKPDNSINRAELLKILVEGKGITPIQSDYHDCFKDVTGQWFAPYVCYAKEVGWVDGYSDGKFRPEQVVNKAEAIKILINSQGIDISSSRDASPFEDVSASDWSAPFVMKAKELGILEETGDSFYGNTEMTRGGISENLYLLLNK